MTQLELFKQTVAHKKHSEWLFYTSFTPDLQERIHKFVGVENKDKKLWGRMFLPKWTGLGEPKDLKKPDFKEFFKDMEMPEKAWINGLGVMEIPGSSYHFTHYVSPLRNAVTLDDIKKYPFTSNKNYLRDHMAGDVKKAHDAGFVAQSWCGHMYEDAWQIRGYEPFLMDMADAPENCEYILDRITENNMEYAIAAAEAGVDLIQTGDDVANQNSMMFSLDTWRRFIKSRWQKVYAAIKKINPKTQIWYHSDGNIEAIIPELIEIGVNILNPVQPECMDPVKLKKKYGDKLVFDGTIGTQTVMPFGKPDDVRKAVREMKEKVGYDGALILSPTHVLEPEVPIDNIMAFLDEAEKKT